MAKKPQRRPAATTDATPVVPIRDEDVMVVVGLQVIGANGFVFGSGNFRVRESLKGKEISLADAVKEPFEALMQVIAAHLGYQVFDVTSRKGPVLTGPPPTVSATVGKA